MTVTAEASPPRIQLAATITADHIHSNRAKKKKKKHTNSVAIDNLLRLVLGSRHCGRVRGCAGEESTENEGDGGQVVTEAS